MESFTHQITLYEALWEMNIEENNHLSFATQSKFAMVYVENNEIIFHYSKEEIIPMVSCVRKSVSLLHFVHPEMSINCHYYIRPDWCRWTFLQSIKQGINIK